MDFFSPYFRFLAIGSCDFRKYGFWHGKLPHCGNNVGQKESAVRFPFTVIVSQWEKCWGIPPTPPENAVRRCIYKNREMVLPFLYFYKYNFKGIKKAVA